jgi:hemolysin D
MSQIQFLPLAENTRIRYLLATQPPRIIHGTLYLLLSLLATVLLWSTISRIDLIVKAPGRVRPTTAPQQVAHTTGLVRNSIRGQIAKVFVQVGDHVKKGDVLAKLDTLSIDNEIDRLKYTVEVRQKEVGELKSIIQKKNNYLQSEVSKAEADLKQGQAQIHREKEQLVAELKAAKTECQAAVENESRKRKLVDQGLRPRNDLDQAVIWLEKSRAAFTRLEMGVDETRLDPLRFLVESVRKRHELEMEDISVRLTRAQEELHSAEKILSNMKQEKEQTILYAHMNGVVTEGDVHEGEIVELGKPLFTIADEHGFQMEVLVASADVGRIQLGMSARIKFDAFDYQKYGTLLGKVVEISPDSQLMEREAGAFYRIKITLPQDELQRGTAKGKIKLGMTGVTEIITDEDTIFAIVLRKLRNKVAIR